LIVDYRTNKLRRICEDAEIATKELGNEMAEKIDQRIGELKAINSLETLLQFKVGGCHKLQGKRKEQLAMYLVHPQRLVFQKIDDQTVQVLEIVDYHN